MPTEELTSLLKEAKRLAKRYRELTGRPLGIVWEIAEFEVAARFLGLEMAPVRTAGYDAIRRLPGGAARRLQIKGRVMRSDGTACCWYCHTLAPPASAARCGRRRIICLFTDPALEGQLRGQQQCLDFGYHIAINGFRGFFVSPRLHHKNVININILHVFLHRGSMQSRFLLVDGIKLGSE